VVGLVLCGSHDRQLLLYKAALGRFIKNKVLREPTMKLLMVDTNESLPLLVPYSAKPMHLDVFHQFMDVYFNRGYIIFTFFMKAHESSLNTPFLYY
jgi:hypothetical protein